MSSLKQSLTNQPWIIAVVICTALVLWMSSGGAESAEQAQAGNKEELLQKVQVTHYTAEQVAKTLSLYGRSESDREALLKAEVGGKIIEVFEQRGNVVIKGEPIARIEMNDLMARFESAKALVTQRNMEYNGLKSLQDKGLHDESRLAQSAAQLKQAEAEVAALELMIDKTLIRAPFDGLLNERFVEVGDYVKVADRIAQVVDLNPLIIRAAVSEMDVTQLKIKQAASARFVNGKVVEGQIRYIARVADQNTNTFEVEVAIANPDLEWLAGSSAELSIDLLLTHAVKVSPAVLSLDESGSLGVKTVQANRVHFVPIDIVKSDSNGMWLAGLGQTVDIITLGQGFVRDGDRVDVQRANATQE